MWQLNPFTGKLDYYEPSGGGISNPLTESLDFDDYPALNFVVEEVDTLPDPSIEGRLVKLSTDKKLYFGLSL